MFHRRPASSSWSILLGLFLTASLAHAEAPKSLKMDGVPRVKQLKNYCGPAALSSVLRYLGRDVSQEAIGQAIYDGQSGATSGADLLLYGRENGFSAYSWNSGTADVKAKLAAGLPVIVLQQNSLTDSSGHYRVLTGYDDNASKFYVMDPYYDDITELSYSRCERLWRDTGHWALVIVPPAKDTFKKELDAHNPVVHMDLSYALYKRKKYEDALKEVRMALNLEPDNTYANSMLSKIRRAMGAGSAPR